MARNNLEKFYSFMTSESVNSDFEDAKSNYRSILSNSQSRDIATTHGMFPMQSKVVHSFYITELV